MRQSNTLVACEASLPPDLERTIFKLAARAYPTRIPNLMLVAWRRIDVKLRVEPLLYRVVLPNFSPTQRQLVKGIPIFTTEILLRVIRNKPLDFIHRSVKHLFVAPGAADAEMVEILQACTGVTNLYAPFSATPDLPLDALRCVQRLAIDLAALQQTLPVDLTASLFRTVTHLELLCMSSVHKTNGVFARLSLLPHLTHVAFNSALHDLVSHAELCADTRLQCIVFLGPAQRAVDMVKAASPLVDDLRFVFFCRLSDHCWDWLRGVNEGGEYWARADVFIARKRAKEVEWTDFTIAEEYGTISTTLTSRLKLLMKLERGFSNGFS
ncbi:hypothetical protein B0H13DRAFT_1705188 [Mycena leptocephala]|nr:hypothetical protein B0H13DRAFT_1705188 [Mycena leptocephala]